MEKNVAKTKVYNVIIMDRSGSMWDIQRPAIQGFNEVLGGVKAAKNKYQKTQEQFITLVLFDSSSIDNVYWNEDPPSLPRKPMSPALVRRSTTPWVARSPAWRRN